MKSAIICDVKIRSLYHSHNIRINQAFHEYFEDNQSQTRKFERAHQVSRIFPKSKAIRSLRYLKMGYYMSPDFSRAALTNDVVLFPSIDIEDFFYLFPLFRKVEGHNRSQKIFLRFLCIDAESFLEKRLLELIVRSLLKIFQKQFPQVIYTAETSEGANYLSFKLKTSVEWLPTPVSDSTKIVRNSSGVLFLPGKPRWDKGSDEISGYAEILSDNRSSVLIAVQTDSAHQYSSTPNLNLAASDLSSEDYDLMLANCQWIFAPHIQSIYRNRGSALLSDAINNEKMILCRRGTALGNFVDKFQIGCVFSDHSDFFTELVNLSSFSDDTSIQLSFSNARTYLNETVSKFFYLGS